MEFSLNIAERQKLPNVKNSCSVSDFLELILNVVIVNDKSNFTIQEFGKIPENKPPPENKP